MYIAKWHFYNIYMIMKIIINKSSKINSPYIYKGLFIFLAGLLPTIIPSVALSQNAENLLNEDVISDNSKDENDSSTEKDKEIPTIIVSSSRTEMLLNEASVPTYVITRQDIEDFGPGDVSQILQQMGGMLVSYSYLGAGVQLQGLEPEHTLILIDGQRIIGAKDGVVDISRLSLTNIERIEIVKGPSSTLYGSNAMGGIINIITRDSNGENFIESNIIYSPQMVQSDNSNILPADIQWGQSAVQQGDVSTGMDTERLSLVATVNYREQEAFDLDDSNIDTNGPKTKQLNGNIKNTLQIADNTELMLDIGYSVLDSERVFSSNAGAVFQQVNKTEDFRVRFRSTTLLPSSQLQASVRASFYKDQYLLDQKDATALDDFQLSNQALFFAGIQQDYIVKNHIITTGLEGFFETLDSDRLKTYSSERYRPALFIQDQYSYLEQLTITTGVRLFWDSWFGTYASPKISMHYAVNPSLSILSSYGLGYRAPSFKEMFLLFENTGVGYVVAGNPDLQPELMRGANLGFNYSPIPLIRIRGNLYRNDLQNLITIGTPDTTDSGLTLFEYQNVNEAFTQGVEIENTIFLRTFSIQGMYTLTDSLDKELQRPLEGRALHNASGQFNWKFSQHTLFSISSNLTGARKFYIDTDGDGIENEVSSDPFSICNIRLSHDIFNSKAKIRIGINNLLNEGDSRFLPIQPRWFFVGMNGKFTQEKIR